MKSILSDTLADRLYLLWCNTSDTLSMSVLSVSAGKDGVLQLKQKKTVRQVWKQHIFKFMCSIVVCR